MSLDGDCCITWLSLVVSHITTCVTKLSLVVSLLLFVTWFSVFEQPKEEQLCNRHTLLS